jgi:hypothetical protein
MEFFYLAVFFTNYVVFFTLSKLFRVNNSIYISYPLFCMYFRCLVSFWGVIDYMKW